MQNIARELHKSVKNKERGANFDVKFKQTTKNYTFA